MSKDTTKEAFYKIYDKIKILSESDFKMSKKAIINNLYRMLKNSGVERIYNDPEGWVGPKTLQKKLEEWGLDVNLMKGEYYHRDFQSQMPNGKRFLYNVSFTDNVGKMHTIPLIATCAFVGKTGTSDDEKYELTYYFAN